MNQKQEELRLILKEYLKIKKMIIYSIHILIFSIIVSSCTNNILSEFGSKSSDDALLFDAETAINAQSYDEAVDIITQRVSATGQLTAKARELLASAYAGQCGLNFIEYTTGLADATSGSTFTLVSAPFVGKAVSPNSCLLSLQTLDLLGTNAQRTASQNSFAAVVGMVLMGSSTRLYTDDNPANGDGSEDAPNSSCSLTNAQMDNIILGYAYMAQNFAALSGQIGNSSSTTVSDSITICNTIAGGACSNTDPAQISDLMRDTMRDLMNTSQYGVGTADGSNPLLIPFACP